MTVQFLSTSVAIGGKVLNMELAASPSITEVPIDPVLARRLKRLASKHDATRIERDAVIREAHQAGASLRLIAELVGVSHVSVRNIVLRDPSES